MGSQKDNIMLDNIEKVPRERGEMYLIILGPLPGKRSGEIRNISIFLYLLYNVYFKILPHAINCV